MKITTINALVEALKSDTPPVRIYISSERHDKRIKEIISICREKKLIFQRIPGEALQRKAGGRNQGVFAELSSVKFHSIDDIGKDKKDNLILILDSIEDTGNLGAILRSAAACEAGAVIISKRNSAPVNETVLKTSAGALMHLKMVLSTNLSRDIENLKKRRFWIAGAVGGEGIPCYDFDFSQPTAIVMGNEKNGISALVKKKCDMLINIPHSSAVESMNVSTAAGIILFEAYKQNKR